MIDLILFAYILGALVHLIGILLAYGSGEELETFPCIMLIVFWPIVWAYLAITSLMESK